MFLKLTLPIMLALSLVFTDEWIIRWFGSYLEAASITWLSYAKTLMRVPLGVVGQAIGVASFPFLAQLYSEKKLDELNRTLNSTLKGVILLLVPISALTIALSSPLVHFVFSWTRLQEPDLVATAATLVFFAIGMSAWGLQTILARGFYAVRDTLTPAIVGTVFTFLNLPVYWWLAHEMRHLGLALASSCGIIAYTIALFIILNRRFRNPEALRLVGFFVKVAAASAVGALVAFGVVTWLGGRIGWQTTWRAFLILVVASVVGLVLTVMFAKLFRVREVEERLQKLLNTRPSSGD
jgi:putative peptidoglycan lipid II flippase